MTCRAKGAAWPKPVMVKDDHGQRWVCVSRSEAHASGPELVVNFDYEDIDSLGANVLVVDDSALRDIRKKAARRKRSMARKRRMDRAFERFVAGIRRDYVMRQTRLQMEGVS